MITCMKIQLSAQVRRIMEPGIKKGTELVIVSKMPTCLELRHRHLKKPQCIWPRVWCCWLMGLTLSRPCYFSSAIKQMSEAKLDSSVWEGKCKGGPDDNLGCCMFTVTTRAGMQKGIVENSFKLMKWAQLEGRTYDILVHVPILL